MQLVERPAEAMVRIGILRIARDRVLITDYAFKKSLSARKRGSETRMICGVGWIECGRFQNAGVRSPVHREQRRRRPRRASLMR